MDSKTEQWKPIPDFEGVYDVSDLGRIMRLTTKSGRERHRILKPAVSPQGYYHVRLCKDSRYSALRVHRLVGVAFCNPPENWSELQINHKDGIKNNNQAENLEWVTCAENIYHAWSVLDAYVKGEDSKLSKLTSPQVLEIRRLYSAGDITMVALGEQFEISVPQISNIITRKQWKHI